MSSNINPLFQYRKDGIYFIGKGVHFNTNLSICYIENSDGVLDFLENILESDDIPYKTKVVTKQVINDLKNNYYYEKEL